MATKTGLKISVVMPVYNGESTIKETLESLMRQTEKFDELIIVNDASTDKSVECIKDFLGARGEYKLICNENQFGLAGSYNKGIRASKGDLVVTLHQDIILENESLKELIKPFGDDRVVAASHVVAHPLEIWNQYNFWQKCFFARLAGKDFSGIDGKFDCFRKSALERVGLFDEINFRTAGEDGDMVYRLKKIGRVVDTKAKIIHLHKVDPKFNWKNIIEKQKQYSEAQGVLFARGRIRSIGSFAKAFFREILIIFLFVPYATYLAAILIVAYAIWYTKLVYLKEYRNPRILSLPFLNIFLLFVSFVYSFRGMIYGKQRV